MSISWSSDGIELVLFLWLQYTLGSGYPVAVHINDNDSPYSNEMNCGERSVICGGPGMNRYKKS